MEARAENNHVLTKPKGMNNGLNGDKGGGIEMIKYFLLSLVCIFTSVVHAYVLQDSFDDNIRNRSIWSPPGAVVSPSNSVASVDFVEQNQRLEFIVSGLASNAFNVGAWQAPLMMLNAELNWTLTADIHNSAEVTESNLVEIGINIFGHSWGYQSRDTGLWLRSTSDGLELHELPNVNFPIENKLDFPEMLTTDGSVRICYAASNQVIEIAYANSPSNVYHLVKSVDTSDWNDILNTGFILDAWALSVNEGVESGEAFVDNILVDYELIDVAVGQMILETTNSEAHLSLQLEKSEDLVTWTNAGNAVEWVMPIATNQQFFRVRSSP